jgi:hypothetical protein
MSGDFSLGAVRCGRRAARMAFEQMMVALVLTARRAREPRPQAIGESTFRRSSNVELRHREKPLTETPPRRWGGRSFLQGQVAGSGTESIAWLDETWTLQMSVIVHQTYWESWGAICKLSVFWPVQ